VNSPVRIKTPREEARPMVIATHGRSYQVDLEFTSPPKV
jgi:hypothetical protein